MNYHVDTSFSEQIRIRGVEPSAQTRVTFLRSNAVTRWAALDQTIFGTPQIKWLKSGSVISGQLSEWNENSSLNKSDEVQLPSGYLT